MNYDRKRIATYMNDFCSGFKNITPRREIVRALNMDDRHFRKVCATMPEIISNSRIKHIPSGWNSIITVKVGYYCLPLTDFNGLETKVALTLIRGLKSRTKELWDRIKRSEQLISERIGKQASFV